MQIFMYWLALSLSFATDRIDRVEATVGEIVILSSDVRMEQILDPIDSPAAPAWGTRESSPLERLIDSASVRADAGGLSTYQASREALETRYEQLRRQTRSPKKWKSLLSTSGLTEMQVLEALKRRITVENYLTQRVAAPVEDTTAWQDSASTLIDQLQEQQRIRRIREQP